MWRTGPEASRWTWGRSRQLWSMCTKARRSPPPHEQTDFRTTSGLKLGDFYPLGTSKPRDFCLRHLCLIYSIKTAAPAVFSEISVIFYLRFLMSMHLQNKNFCCVIVCCLWWTVTYYNTAEFTQGKNVYFRGQQRVDEGQCPLHDWTSDWILSIHQFKMQFLIQV